MWVRGLKHLDLETYNKRIDVAPHVGAWIETDKPTQPYRGIDVAPHVDAWIETQLGDSEESLYQVAPHVGAWIETARHARCTGTP